MTTTIFIIVLILGSIGIDVLTKYKITPIMTRTMIRPMRDMLTPLEIENIQIYKCVSIEERFWKKVQKDDLDKCWNWTASRTQNGYGRFCIGKNKYFLAHRISYMLSYRVDPGELSVCHACDVPSCVNPNHLFLGTHKENIHDSIKKGRWDKNSVPNGITNRNKTHCINGHEFTPENTYHYSQKNNAKGRRCLTCSRERMLKYREKHYVHKKRKQKTHCKNGHEFTAENTYETRQKDNKYKLRRCRTCERDKTRAIRAKKPR